MVHHRVLRIQRGIYMLLYISHSFRPCILPIRMWPLLPFFIQNIPRNTHMIFARVLLSFGTVAPILQSYTAGDQCQWHPLNEMGKCIPWASYQIRKIPGCACAGNAGNVFPRRRFQRKPLVCDPGMHHGTCVTHVPWCMSGSLTCSDEENILVIPGACAPVILRIWQEAHGFITTFWYRHIQYSVLSVHILSEMRLDSKACVWPVQMPLFWQKDASWTIRHIFMDLR